MHKAVYSVGQLGVVSDTAAFCGRNYGTHAIWDRLRGLLFEARLDYLDRPYDPDLLAAARTPVAASNSLLLVTAEDALDFIEGIEAPNVNLPTLNQLARFSREENERVRGMLAAIWNAPPRSIAEGLFRLCSIPFLPPCPTGLAMRSGWRTKMPILPTKTRT